MQDLGTLGYNYTVAYAVSGDASTVVGEGALTGFTPRNAFRWTEDGGMQDLGRLGGNFSLAYDVNTDGSVVVGSTDTASVATHAFRWTDAGGMVDLGALSGGSYSAATGVSGDGAVVVGYSNTAASSSQFNAFRWTDTGGMENLGGLYSGGGSRAYDVSANGAVIVGEAWSSSSGGLHPFRWTETGGMQDLGLLTGGDTGSARAANSDGTVVVGSADSSDGTRAFRWVEGSGMENLGTLGGGTYSLATDVNADGSVVVGSSNSSDGTRAFRWVEGSGMESLGTLGGGTYSWASGVSDDGEVVVGYAEDFAGDTRAFIWRAGPMLDLLNTQAAVSTNAGQQAAAVAQRNAALGLALRRELDPGAQSPNGTVVSSQGAPTLRLPFAIRLDGAVADNSAGGRLRYGGVSAAVGLEGALTLGGFVWAGSEASSRTGFAMTGNQPAAGLYLRSGGLETGGLSWKLAFGGSAGDAEITRPDTLPDTEAGHGTARLTTSTASAEIGWGMRIGQTLLMPYARLTSAATSRGAYDEATDISFPISYDAYSLRETTLTLAVRGRVALGPATDLDFGAGIEHDLARSDDPVTGTSAIPGMTTFSVAGPAVVNPARAFASIGLGHDLGGGRRIMLDANLTQSAYATTPDLGVAIGFEMRF